MAHTFTDRYVDAVTRTLPEEQRDDVARELRASIDDQVAARTEGGEPETTAERAVLEELGDPDRLAAGYADRPAFLLGPRYYFAWKRLLIVLLWIVPACSALGVALGQALSGAAPGTIIGAVASSTVTVIVHLCFWTTAVFVVLERTGARDPLTPWTVDRLPEIREKGAGFGDLVGIVLCTLLFAGAIAWDLTLGFVPGEQVSFLNGDLWPVRLTFLALLAAAAIVLQAAVWAQGTWRLWSAVVNAVLAVAAGLVLVYAQAEVGLVNPAFFEAVAGDGGAEVFRVFEVLVWFGIVAGTAWSAVEGFLKLRRR